MKIQTVSSRWTFFLKMAFPLLWLIIMGGISAVVIISSLETLKEPFNPATAKVLTLSFYLTVLGLLYIMFGKSSWVGINDKHLYVSNYFKSYKYTFDSISRIEEVNMFLYTKVVLHFHQPSKFGPNISFIRSHYWKYFLEKHPDVLVAMSNKINNTITETVER